MSRLGRSVDAVDGLLATADLSGDGVVAEVLSLTYERRRLDLSDLSPEEQADLIAQRCERLQPSPAALAERFKETSAGGRPFVAKFGIDPTSADVHIGHTVPMLLLSRLQRMGHHIVFIVGDVTAKIGDPSGRSDERPALTDADIAANLATYRQQVTPFFDFTRAEFRYNGDWLRQVTLPRLIEVASHVPVSMALQREDFRTRLAGGHSLSLAELLYSVAMALDSVEVRCDLEVGGLDQFLNMQMCRKVMEICGQAPELVVATFLLEGTDGTGAKMSASRGNYVPLTATPGEVFGKLMSVPDRLVEPYLRALSEWQAPELATVTRRLDNGSLHPMDLKRLLAGEVAAAVHGVEAAMMARSEFAAQFSQRRLSDVATLPVVDDVSLPVVEALRSLGFVKSNGEARRLAGQKALRLLVAEGDGASRELAVLAEADLYHPVAALLSSAGGDASYYLRAGRRVARLSRRGGA
jgi:tyrosyl-tRNA synthetase